MRRSTLGVIFLGLCVAGGPLATKGALALPAIVIDAASGQVLYAQDATASWYPASLTKLMTTYVALKAVKDGRLSMQTPMMVSARAARMAPSKMGFRPGSLVTLENALKMLMVKSPNDVAVTIAEGVSGSVEAFANEMNQQAALIGMRESYFVNPNGLPASAQVSSARDMALLGRALYIDFPEHADLFNIGALRLGDQIIPTHNGMLGRYPGADGMKTGFTCAAGFNLVASATRGGRKLIVTVMGAPSVASRTMWAAALLDRAFANPNNGSGSAQALPSSGVRPAPDQHNAACRNRAATIAALEAEVDDISKSTQQPAAFSLFGGANAPLAFVSPSGGEAPARQIASLPRPNFAPVDVYVGPAPGWTGPIARPTGSSEKVLTPATVKSDADEEASKPHMRPGTAKARMVRAPKIDTKTGAADEAPKSKKAIQSAHAKTVKKVARAEPAQDDDAPKEKSKSGGQKTAKIAKQALSKHDKKANKSPKPEAPRQSPADAGEEAPAEE